MQQSNTYIIVFSVILTVVLGGVLALASEGLKPMQKRNKEVDTKYKILSAVMDLKKNKEVLDIYDKRISGTVVNINGNKIEGVNPSKVSIGSEYKKDPEDRKYPVFFYSSKVNPDKITAVIVPVYGNGLWDNIWGFLALEPDLNTIKGVIFDHKSETPGLGARITNENVQQRFVGKKIYNEEGKVVGITMLKGEGHDIPEDEYHKVNGLSGATMTCKGVNKMLEKYLKYYDNYFEKLKESGRLDYKENAEQKASSEKSGDKSEQKVQKNTSGKGESGSGMVKADTAEDGSSPEVIIHDPINAQ